jgi:hypothetical protein
VGNDGYPSVDPTVSNSLWFVFNEKIAHLVSNVAPSSAGLVRRNATKQPALIAPSRPDKKLCRSVEVSADSPNVLCPHAEHVWGRRQSRWLSHPGGFAVSENANSHDALKVESAKEREQ